MKEKIEAIIFDFGGVIINIDPSETEQAFLKTSKSPQLLATRYGAFMQIHNSFETGEISSDAFRDQTRDLFEMNHLDDQSFDEAWNALLLDIPGTRIEFLENLAAKHRIFLLSNTNAIHYEKYSSDFTGQHPGKVLEGLFEKAFFSFKLGLRKPDPAIFNTVIRQCGLTPEQTLFIDDTLQHVEAAVDCGLKTHYLKHDEEIITVLKHLI